MNKIKAVLKFNNQLSNKVPTFENVPIYIIEYINI